VIRGFYTARSGLIYHQENMNLISNNMANVNTVGFKSQRASFTDLIYQNINRPTAAETAMIGHGVKINKSDLIMMQGALTPTQRPTDFALTNHGEFFAVRGVRGEIEFTRAGNFMLSLDEDGLWYLAAPNGDRVLNGEFEPIPIEFEQAEHREFHYTREPLLDENGAQVVVNGVPQFTEVRDVDADGNYIYTLTYTDGLPIIDIDAIGIFRFDNPYGLFLIGNTRFIVSENSGEAVEVEGVRGIRSGTLEASNVEIAAEMVRVIEASRAFSFNSRMVQIADEVENTVNTLR
jgi:flagellar basal-body rod protein FlgG